MGEKLPCKGISLLNTLIDTVTQSATLVYMEFLQMLLLSTGIVLLGVVIFCVIQVLYILLEIRKSAEKINMIMDNTVKISENISSRISSVSGLFTGVNLGSTLIGLFKAVGWLRKMKGEKKDGE